MVVSGIMKKKKRTNTHTKSLDVEGKKFGVNGSLEEERLFRAQAEEEHPGKSLVPGLAAECCITLKALF